MSAFWAMLRKQSGETRWSLGISAVALFFLSWLGVYATSSIESRIRKAATDGEEPPRMRVLRGMGGPSMDFSTVAIECTMWNHPFILLPIIVWAIGRGSSAVAREVERGTLDPILSRPVSRSSYLGSQILHASVGLLVLGAALVAGNQAGRLYYTLESPPSAWLVAKPALNLAALGFAIYGGTTLFSAVDIVSWRPMLIGSALTLVEFVIHVLVNLPAFEDWQKYDHLSIFRAYDPVEIVTTGETLNYNVAALLAVAITPIVIAFAAFSRRDLPANS